MPNLNEANYISAESEDFLVTAYPEHLTDDGQRNLWGYCLRIENNSEQKISLIRKDFCITDSNGDNHYDFSQGFHGEIPDLAPGEYFDFEDTALIDAESAVLYGNCYAVGKDGQQFCIKIPATVLHAVTGEYDAVKH